MSDLKPAAWILVVEDDDDNRELVVEILTQAGYEARSVSTGAQALEMLQGETPCLVLADLLMNGMDGRELLVRARRLLAGAMPPFVFVTAAHPSWCEDISGTILTKPIDVTQLLGIVAHHCAV
jgi:CheY-like chemotaxis protein